MKLSRDLQKQIRQAIKDTVPGATLFRIGFREDATYVPASYAHARQTLNYLRWPEDSDLWDNYTLQECAKWADDDAVEHEGHSYIALDVYVYTGRGHLQELETNVYVFIKDGKVVKATDRDLRAKAIQKELGFPDSHF